MKIYILLVLMIICIISIMGCAQQAQIQQQTEQTMPAESPQEPPSTEFTMNMLYNYAKISEFEYKITSNAGGQQNVMNMKYKISSDTANGKAAWLQQSDMDVEGVTATIKLWLDKDSLACLKTSTVMNVAGQTIHQEGQCPTEGPNSASETADAAVNYIGKESVTVPAGTFSAKKYESNGANYWISDNVPLPLKVSYSGEEHSVMELVSYK